ncbi:hypothetical protein ACFQXA_37025 [Nocardiopsis composta]
MSGGLRHGVGAAYGVALLLLVPLVLGTGMGWLYRGIMTFQFAQWQPLAGVVLVVAGAVLLGLAAAPWMSPLAGLISGALFTLYGFGQLVFFGAGGGLGPLLQIDPMWQSAGMAMYLLIGPLLLMTAVWPSRWRSPRVQGRRGMPVPPLPGRRPAAHRRAGRSLGPASSRAATPATRGPRASRPAAERGRAPSDPPPPVVPSAPGRGERRTGTAGGGAGEGTPSRARRPFPPRSRVTPGRPFPERPGAGTDDPCRSRRLRRTGGKLGRPTVPDPWEPA